MSTNALINPICAACKENIGEMPLDIYLKAVEARGEYLFCPDCRKHKCDSCGWFVPQSIVKPVYTRAVGFVGNACETCADWILETDGIFEKLPYFRTMEKPNLRHITFQNGAPAIDYAAREVHEEERWDDR